MAGFEIFIDSADIDEIREAYDLGVVRGVTTNPTLLLKAAKNRGIKGLEGTKKYIDDIFDVAGSTPVSLEVIGTSYEQMVNEAETIVDKFGRHGRNIFIKIPVNPALGPEDDNHFDGYRAIRTLSDKGTNVNSTLVFTPDQAYWAAMAGAKLISPFLGCVNHWIALWGDFQMEKGDYFPAVGLRDSKGDFMQINGIHSGIHLVKLCADVVKETDAYATVLAASIRHPREVIESMLAGAGCATVPYSIIKSMLQDELTYKGMRYFMKDAEGIQGYKDLLSPEV